MDLGLITTLLRTQICTHTLFTALLHSSKHRNKDRISVSLVSRDTRRVTHVSHDAYTLIHDRLIYENKSAGLILVIIRLTISGL